MVYAVFILRSKTIVPRRRHLQAASQNYSLDTNGRRNTKLVEMLRSPCLQPSNAEAEGLFWP